MDFIINVCNKDEIKMVKSGSSLTPHESQELMKLLKEFNDIFTWSYKDMHGNDLSKFLALEFIYTPIRTLSRGISFSNIKDEIK